MIDSPTASHGGESTDPQQTLLNMVAKAAQTQLGNLPPLERANLLDGLALITPSSESEQCRVAAQAIRDAEQAQMILHELFDAL